MSARERCAYQLPPTGRAAREMLGRVTFLRGAAAARDIMGRFDLDDIRDMREWTAREIVTACAPVIGAEMLWREIGAEWTRLRCGG